MAPLAGAKQVLLHRPIEWLAAEIAHYRQQKIGIIVQ